jgi:hypothetical protein
MRWSSNHINKKLTPWIRFLLEKLIVAHLVKSFCTFYGNRSFTCLFSTRPRHWSLSWARLIQPTIFHSVFLRSILILYTHLRLDPPSDLLPSDFSCQHFVCISSLSNVRYMPCPSHHPRLEYPNNILWSMQNMTLFIVIKHVGGCIQKFPYWPPRARAANDTALCH